MRYKLLSNGKMVYTYKKYKIWNDDEMKLNKNDAITLEITGYTSDGSGVGHSKDGIAVFVPLAAKGDKLEVKILKTAKTYAFGKIEKILEPSNDRIKPDCPQFSKCGGCVYRHISYRAELEAKRQRVNDAIERIGGFKNMAIKQILGAENVDRYRNKAQLPVDKAPNGIMTLGFFAKHSHRVINCEECLLQPEAFTAAMKAFKEWQGKTGEDVYDEKTGRGHLRHLFLRQAPSTGEIMVCVVVNGNGVHNEPLLVKLLTDSVPGLKSVMINVNKEKTNVILGEKYRTIWGQDFITDELCGLKFRISLNSFYQINSRQAEKLYTLAGNYAGLTGKETVLDLYCGTGTIGLSMAKNAGRVIGVEVVEHAVEDARKNAKYNEISNAEFICSDASKAAEKIKSDGTKPDVVILDPPRKGCGAGLVETVAKMGPERVVYVSCDPATLARDLKLFAGMGYQPKEITPVDMFPRTAHVESVVLMSRVKE